MLTMDIGMTPYEMEQQARRLFATPPITETEIVVLREECKSLNKQIDGIEAAITILADVRDQLAFDLKKAGSERRRYAKEQKGL